MTSTSDGLISLRSRLYQLRPAGIGTGLVEGLTGYVSRLAAAHAISVGDLVGRELRNLETGPNRGVQVEFIPSWLARLPSDGYEMNGIADPPSALFDLSAATLLTTIQQLPFLPCNTFWFRLFIKCARGGNLLPRLAGHYDIVHDPLLWSLDVVSACPVHNERLAEVCVRCL